LVFACPVCGERLADDGPSARCPHGHSFDYGRPRYLNLAVDRGRGRRQGDTREMVEARAAFLDTGHLAPVAEAVAGVAAEADERAPDAVRSAALVEIGCGTSHYLTRVAERLEPGAGGEAIEGEADRAADGPGGDERRPVIGLDLSRPAVIHSARRHPRFAYAVADVETGIPLLGSSAGLVLSVFSPRPAAEIARVVRAGGAAVGAFATPRHLRALRERLGLIAVRERKLEELSERLAPWFELDSTGTFEYGIRLTPEDARNAVAMGPNARHFAEAREHRPLDDEVSVEVARFRRRDDA